MSRFTGSQLCIDGGCFVREFPSAVRRADNAETERCVESFFF
jgi:hypothetical protein